MNYEVKLRPCSDGHQRYAKEDTIETLRWTPKVRQRRHYRNAREAARGEAEEAARGEAKEAARGDARGTPPRRHGLHPTPLSSARCSTPTTQKQQGTPKARHSDVRGTPQGRQRGRHRGTPQGDARGNVRGDARGTPDPTPWQCALSSGTRHIRGMPKGDTKGRHQRNASGTPKGDAKGRCQTEARHSDVRGTPQGRHRDARGDATGGRQRGCQRGRQTRPLGNAHYPAVQGTSEGCQREIPKGDTKGTPAERQREMPKGDARRRCQREISKGDTRGRRQSDPSGTPEGHHPTPWQCTLFHAWNAKHKSNKGYQRNAAGTPEEYQSDTTPKGRQARRTPGQRDAKGPSKEPQRKAIQWDASRQTKTSIRPNAHYSTPIKQKRQETPKARQRDARAMLEGCIRPLGGTNCSLGGTNCSTPVVQNQARQGLYPIC